MSHSQPIVPDRRRFLKTVGLASLASTMAPTIHALAQSATPPAGSTEAKPDSVATPAPASPPEISEDARALAEIVRRRYGQHLNSEQLEAVTRELDGRIRGGRTLRDAKLVNADEPDVTFHA